MYESWTMFGMGITGSFSASRSHGTTDHKRAPRLRCYEATRQGFLRPALPGAKRSRTSLDENSLVVHNMLTDYV